MKNLRKLIGIISITAIIACAMTACPGPWPIPDNNQTPVADDYDVGGNLTQTAGSVTGVTITAKSGKSKGAITIKYSGSTTIPQTAGSHAITFDVAAATGWNAVAGLSAGTLTVVTPTPVVGDYEINGLAQSRGSVKAVTIEPKSGKSSGQRTIYYEGTSGTTYTKSPTLPNPSTNGTYTYAVTFDVAAATGWNKADGLSAGTLVINDLKTPKADDYTYGNLTQKAGSVTAVTVTRKTSDTSTSSGQVTVYYTGNGTTNSPKTATVPQATGTYAVTFDVAAVSGSWNPATGLSAGTLTVNNDANVPVTGITLTGPTDNKGNVRKTMTITAVIQPANATKKEEIKWSLEFKGDGWLSYDREDYLLSDYGTITPSDGASRLEFTPPRPGSYAFSAKTATGTTGASISQELKIEVEYLKNGDFQYEEQGNMVQISGYTGSSKSVSIPGTIGGKPVVSIGYDAFYGKSLTSVTIPNSVQYIGMYAFMNNNLERVDIPSSVIYINDNAFNNNNLKRVDIPSSVIIIGDYAFANNSPLAAVTFIGTSNVNTIGEGAFCNAFDLASFEIPESVEEIGASLFADRTDYEKNLNLNSVTFNKAGVNLGYTSYPTTPNSSASPSFPGRLDEVYKAGGIATYTREKDGDGNWGAWAKKEE